MISEQDGDGVELPADVSAIVVNWNTRELLRDCLESLRRVSPVLTLEVIVVDNGSGDGSPEMVAADFPEVRLIRNADNRGFAAANNQGIACAAGRYVLLLNSDAVLKPGALEKVLAEAEADPRAGMIGCRVLNSDGSLQVSCMRFPDFRGLLASALFLPRLFPRCRCLGYEDLTWWAHDSDREVEVLKGCFILVRAEAIRQVGMLDEEFWLYGEETDWCRRVSDGGWRIRFLSEPEIIHHGGASTEQAPDWIVHQLWGAKLQFVRKHRSSFQHRLCCGAVALWFGLRIPTSLAAAVLDRRRRADHRRRAATCSSGLSKLLLRGASSLVRTGDPAKELG